MTLKTAMFLIVPVIFLATACSVPAETADRSVQAAAETPEDAEPVEEGSDSDE